MLMKKLECGSMTLVKPALLYMMKLRSSYWQDISVIVFMEGQTKKEENGGKRKRRVVAKGKLHLHLHVNM